MLFEEFAHKMGNVIKGNATNSDFVRTLFEAMLPEKKKDLLAGRSDNTLRGYYNGGKPIAQIARELYADINIKSFEKFIDGHGTEAKRKLTEEFSDICPEINSKNAGEVLADLFHTIIKEAAQDKDDVQDKGSSYVYMNGQNNINNTGTINISL